ncbi:MAG TPA: hypothetical protein RMG45_26950, partial [Polyangiaceae bacterium LLY-WYZ-15_(1-7)]|nr:hypothetical protein [Polyangiaceae bacterium LLY-WYZ-15_(1-7)]
MALQIDEATHELLQSYGFDEETFETLRARLKAGEAGAEQNRIRGEVTPPEAEDVTTLPAVGSAEREALAAKGREAIAAGQVGAIVLAG